MSETALLYVDADTDEAGLTRALAEVMDGRTGSAWGRTVAFVGPGQAEVERDGAVPGFGFAVDVSADTPADQMALCAQLGEALARRRGWRVVIDPFGPRRRLVLPAQAATA